MNHNRHSNNATETSKDIHKEEAISRGSKQSIYFSPQASRDKRNVKPTNRTKRYPVFSIDDPTRYEIDMNDL